MDKEYMTKLGPYSLGPNDTLENGIYHGDVRELAKVIPDASIDLMIADPPYFLPVNTYVGVRGTQYHRTIGDMSVMQTYFDVMLGELSAKLKTTGTVYVFCDGQSYPLMYRAMCPHFKYVRPLIWDKIVSYNGYTWRHQHELIAWGEGFDAKRVPTGDGDILRIRGVKQADRLHVAEKPIGLITRLIAKHNAEIIIDPYCGCGTVAAACKQLGRQYLAFEIDAATVEIARKRVQNTRPPLFVPENTYQQTGLLTDEA